MTEYKFYGAGRIDSARKGEPIAIGIRFGVGKHGAAANMPLTIDQALAAAADLIAAIRVANREANDA
jgi:hypothetical protein